MGIDGTFVAKYRGVQCFFENCCRVTDGIVDGIPPDEWKNLFEVLSDILLTAYFRITALKAERDNNNGILESVLPVRIPFQIYDLQLHEFFQVVKMQRECLCATHSTDGRVRLEAKFRAFRKLVSFSQATQNNVSMY